MSPASPLISMMAIANRAWCRRILPRAPRFDLTIVAVLGFVAALPLHTGAVELILGTDKTWPVTDETDNGLRSGLAQEVCLSFNKPANCPPGATQFQPWNTLGPSDWAAVPGAKWIWASDIDATTTNAYPASYLFERQFYICDTPTVGELMVAADNEAEVFVNGISVGKDNEPQGATIINILGALQQYLNTIQIKGSNLEGCAADTYACNPAALALTARVGDGMRDWPKCEGKDPSKPSDPSQLFDVGESQTRPCGPGKRGVQERICGCFAAQGIFSPWGTCRVPPSCSDGSNIREIGYRMEIGCGADRPLGEHYRTCSAQGGEGVWEETNTCAAPSCTGEGGMLRPIGFVESLDCPAGQLGEASRICRQSPDGKTADWVQATNSCAPPVLRFCQIGPNAQTLGSPMFVRPGYVDAQPCNMPLVGVGTSRTCLPDGTWTAETRDCRVRQVGIGEVCFDPRELEWGTAACPVGTECRRRPSGGLVTTQAFCDPYP